MNSELKIIFIFATKFYFLRPKNETNWRSKGENEANGSETETTDWQNRTILSAS